MDREAWKRLLYACAIMVLGSGVMALLVLAIANPRMPQGLAYLGLTTFIAVPLLTTVLGGATGVAWRRKTKSWPAIAALLVAAIVIIVVSHFIGLVVPPLVGQSENPTLFPSLGAFGLILGFFADSSPLKPDRKLRQKSVHALKITFNDGADIKVVAGFRWWLKERFDAQVDDEIRVHLVGPRGLRKGLSEIRDALGERGLTDYAKVERV